MVALSSLAGAGWQFFDDNGVPLAGGKIYTYAAGTTTPATTYTDSTGNTPHSNPIILDSAGRVSSEVWLTTGTLYKFALTTPSDVIIWTKDNVPGIFASQTLTAADVVLTGFKGQVGTVADLADDGGSDFIGFLQGGGATAIPRSLQDKARDFVSVKDFGAVGDGVANDTAAVHAAMNYLMDRFPGNPNYYPGGINVPTSRDRRTGSIYFPAGTYRLSSNVFSSLANARAVYVGFEFIGDHRLSSVLLLETNGGESWFYNNGPGNERYQRVLFKSLGFRSDDYRYGNGFKIYSEGGPKQFRFEHCDFENLQKFMYTLGIGNADLTKVIACTGWFFGDILTLSNPQSVQHDFIGCDFSTYANFVHVEVGGGGNVNFINGAIDFLWHVDYSPPFGNWMFLMDAGANVDIGNCSFIWRDCRIEIEAYTRTPGNPPLGLVASSGNPQAALPTVMFDNVNFVNGLTYTIDLNGNIVSSEYRRINAVSVYPRQRVYFNDCMLLKNFFYTVNGLNNLDSPNSGGIIKFMDCFDGVSTQLPSGDSAKQILHDRVTYTSNSGRVMTLGMSDQGTGSPFIRKALDVDPNWQRAYGREESSIKKILSFKPTDNGWPFAANATNDYYIDLPQQFLALRVYIFKPAVGTSANAYQLYLGTTDKATVFATSTSSTGQFKDAHTIDISYVSFSGYGQLRLWAVGAGANFQNGGIAYIEYI
jgi:hypothetical protein